MATEQGPMSGFRDLLAEHMLPRDSVVRTITTVYERYGFVPLKTPTLERLATLTGKYGEEGDKLMYSFKDNGQRDVAMRYDHTVPLARVVAQHGEKLPKPYKRYALGDVWRGESPQAGRYREFTQLDADIVGTSSYLADTEVIAMISDAMAAIGVAATVRVNDRGLLDGLAEVCGITAKKDFYKLVGAIDKVEKIGAEAVLKEIDAAFGTATKDIVTQYLDISGTTKEKLDALAALLDNKPAAEAVGNLTNILNLLEAAGYGGKIIFDQNIARGLSYYTGTIYETSVDDLPSIGSVCSGGRYDELIKQLGGPDTPAVGISIGVDRLLEAMRQLGLLKEEKTKTSVYITNVEAGLDEDRFKLVQMLRENGIAAELVYDAPKLGKQIGTIDKLGVGKIIILGSKEKASGSVVIKDLATGQQKEVTPKDIISELMEDS